MQEVKAKLPIYYETVKKKVGALKIKEGCSGALDKIKNFSNDKVKDWGSKSIDGISNDDVSYSYDPDSEKYRIPWTSYPVNIGTAYTISTFELVFLILTLLMVICHYSFWIPEYEATSDASAAPRAILIISLLQLFCGIGFVGLVLFGIYHRRPAFVRVHALIELIGCCVLVMNSMVVWIIVQGLDKPEKLLATSTPPTLIALAIIFIPVAVVEVYFSLTMKTCALWLADVHEFRKAVEAARDLHKKRAMIEARKDLETIFDAIDKLNYTKPIEQCSLERQAYKIHPADVNKLQSVDNNNVNIVYEDENGNIYYTTEPIDENEIEDGMEIIEEEEEEFGREDEENKFREYDRKVVSKVFEDIEFGGENKVEIEYNNQTHSL